MHERDKAYHQSYGVPYDPKLRGQTNDVIFYDDAQTFDSPKKSRYDDFLEQMGGKKIENPCSEIPNKWIVPSIQINGIANDRHAPELSYVTYGANPAATIKQIMDCAAQKAKEEIQVEEDCKVFKDIDINHASALYDELINISEQQSKREREKLTETEIIDNSIKEHNAAIELMNQKAKDTELIKKLIIHNDDYMVVKRNNSATTQSLEQFINENKYAAHNSNSYFWEDVVPVNKILEWKKVNIEPEPEHYSQCWNTDYLKLPKDRQEIVSIGEKSILNMPKADQVLTWDSEVEAWKTEPMEDKTISGGAAMKYPIDSSTVLEPQASSEEKKPEIDTVSLKDTFQEIMKFAEIFEENLPQTKVKSAFSNEQKEELIARALASEAGKDVLRSSIIDAIKKMEEGIDKELNFKKKKRTRRKVAPINPFWLFTIAATGAGLAHHCKEQMAEPKITVKQIKL